MISSFPYMIVQSNVTQRKMSCDYVLSGCRFVCRPELSNHSLVLRFPHMVLNDVKVDKYCYLGLGDVLDADGAYDSAVTAMVRCTWKIL